MKVGGVPISKPEVDVFVLPRPEGDLVFRGQAVDSLDEYLDQCGGIPKPPRVLTKNGWEDNTEDKSYRDIIRSLEEKRISYMVLRTLEPSDIEWSSVDINSPSTWSNWEKDFREAGLTQVEVQRLFRWVMDINCLNESKLKEAREVFLAGIRQRKDESSGHQTEPENTQSGEPAVE